MDGEVWSSSHGAVQLCTTDKSLRTEKQSTFTEMLSTTLEVIYKKVCRGSVTSHCCPESPLKEN
ncbi:hypothetical protein AQUCO_00900118v1 [Aquilegia coerulea]|uniref:Uncharacterized protein n=1 Tax=Aquilegia coerulea TaxID=218851 RepID=A0A2G5EC80_AQUCA|nr:hypothetical protein AQUCO_00900118v1 [Aquilegia coerulea]